MPKIKVLQSFMHSRISKVVQDNVRELSDCSRAAPYPRRTTRDQRLQICQAERAVRARDEVGSLLRPSMPAHSAPWPVAVRIVVVLLFCLTAGCATALVITSIFASGDFDCDTKVLAAVNSATFVPELQVSDERYVIAYGRCTLDLSYSIRGVEHQSNFTTSCDLCQDLYNKQGQPAISFQSTQAIPEP